MTSRNDHHNGIMFQAAYNAYTDTQANKDTFIHTYTHMHVSVLINDTHAHKYYMPTTERSLTTSQGTKQAPPVN